MSEKNNNDSTICIGIPTFNSSKYIHRSVNSALNQTLVPAEIIIVDDFSTDNTYEIITNLSHKYKNIKIFRNDKNYGVAYTRNQILKLSHSEYIAFFDDDDYSYPDRLKAQFNYLKQYKIKFKIKNSVLCFSSRKQVFENGRVNLIHPMGTLSDSIAPNGPIVAEAILFGKKIPQGFGSCATSSLLCKISDLKKIDYFDDIFRRLEDTDLNIRASLQNFHFLGLKKILVKQYLIRKDYKNMQNEIFYFQKLYDKYLYKIYDNNNRNYKFELKFLIVKSYLYKKKWFIFLIYLFFLLFMHPVLLSRRLSRLRPNLKNHLLLIRNKNY